MLKAIHAQDDKEATREKTLMAAKKLRKLKLDKMAEVAEKTAKIHPFGFSEVLVLDPIGDVVLVEIAIDIDQLDCFMLGKQAHLARTNDVPRHDYGIGRNLGHSRRNLRQSCQLSQWSIRWLSRILAIERSKVNSR